MCSGETNNSRYVCADAAVCKRYVITKDLERGICGIDPEDCEEAKRINRLLDEHYSISVTAGNVGNPNKLEREVE